MIILFITLVPLVILSSGQPQHSNIPTDNTETNFIKASDIVKGQGEVNHNDKDFKQGGGSCDSRRTAAVSNNNNDADKLIPSASSLEWRPVLPIKKQKEYVDDHSLLRSGPSPEANVRAYSFDEEEKQDTISEAPEYPPKTQGRTFDDIFSNEPQAKPPIENIQVPRREKSELDCSIIKDLGLLGETSGRRFLSPESRQELILKLHNHLTNDHNVISDNIIARKIENEAQRNELIAMRPNLGTRDTNFLFVTPKPLLAVKNELLEPTKGIGIVSFSKTKMRTLDNSRVCYACSTKNDPTCWKPDRKTTVKYCREGRESCITRNYNHSLDATLVVIRDCGSACDSVAIGDMKYLSCSICQDDLCNSHEVYNNSSSVNYISLILICVASGFVQYTL